MRTTRLLKGDCRAVLARLEPCSVDAVVTDPPYELGFMGKAWDGTGVAFDPATWLAVLRALKPGGHLLAFGGTRTAHRMVCAIEDAGFEIRDDVHWFYGTGFPKAGRVALKPAHEPICLARKPLTGPVAANLARWGTGTLNIDACRIAGPASVGGRKGSSTPLGLINDDGWQGQGARAINRSMVAGRWPANVLLDEDAAAELDAQSGDRSSHGDLKPYARSERRFNAFGAPPPASTTARTGDVGGASRFFYVAKPSRSERGAGNTHPTVKPLQLMRYLVRLVTPERGLVLDPFAGSGTTGLAARAEGRRFLGIEREAAYLAIARARLADAVSA